MVDERTIEPARKLRADVRVPGDKSISHRALLLAALAEGRSTITGLPQGRDVASTISALRDMGVGIRVRNRTDADGLLVATGMEAMVEGRGIGGLSPAGGSVDCGNSGTTMRLLTGIVAGHPFETVLDGDRSLRRRPMGRIAEPLRVMGARIETGRDDTPPLRVHGPDGPLRGGSHRPSVASAQVKSAILLAALHAAGETVVHELRATRDHTERMLAALGAEIGIEGETDSPAVRLRPPPRLRGLEAGVPGDVSSAAYWIAAAIACDDGEVTVRGVGLNPGRTGFLRVLQEWGADLSVEETGREAREPVGRIRASGGGRPLRGGRIGGDDVPGLIDELPLLAALAPFTDRGVEITGAGELRVKESDRIATMAAALRAVGVRVDEYPDGLAVAGRQEIEGGTVDAAGDHRIALALAAVAVAASGSVTIGGAGAAAVSYPGFFDGLREATAG